MADTEFEEFSKQLNIKTVPSPYYSWVLQLRKSFLFATIFFFAEQTKSMPKKSFAIDDIWGLQIDTNSRNCANFFY